MNTVNKPVIATLVACHFIAAFAALGMPPFFALILDKSFLSNDAYLAGWLYVVPIFFTAVSSPWWGRLADRYGTKALLLRAQIGLSASFLLAGFAPNVTVFVVALALQGLLGGTFGASNAYLATLVSGDALSRGLNLMQGSARAALVAAPAGLGLMMTVESPLELYRYLALLPLVAALLVARLPSTGTRRAATRDPVARTRATPEASSRQIYVAQFAFVFATVVTFPYFVPFTQHRVAGVPLALAGVLFGLPHFVYLLGAAPLSRLLAPGKHLTALAIAFLVLAASLMTQALLTTSLGLTASRVAMGLGMTLGFVSLHALIAAVVTGDNAGRTFGWFESSSKWGAVAAGLAAGIVVQVVDLRVPFLIGAVTLLVTAAYFATLAFQRLTSLKENT